MSFNYNKILELPERLLLNKKLTKVFFLKNFELSVIEKKVLNNDIIKMEWLSRLLPSNSNIPEFKDENYFFEEVQFMICTIDDNLLSVKSDICISIFQKYIPYQIILIIEDNEGFIINTSDKRINLNDKSKRTIEKQFTTPIIPKFYKNDITTSFFESIKFIKQDKLSLQSFYNGYIDLIIQYKSSLITGTFQKKNRVRSEIDINLLETMNMMENELSKLSNQIKKELQINKKVSMNIEIQKLRKELDKIKIKLIANE